MMKKVIVSVFFLFSLLLLSSPLMAQEKAFQNPASDIYPVPPYRDNPTVLGQDHAYSVTFRGNGEAVVSAKVVFTNLSDNPLSSMSLRVPRIDAKDVIVFQVLRDRQCIRFRPMPFNEPQIEKGLRPCAEYQEPDYYDYYSNSKYQKAQSELRGDTIDIRLPQAIQANKSGAFLVYYRAFGYARKNVFGAFPFTFETLKVEDTIRNLTVGISTDSDLVLKGAKGKVNYRFTEGMMAMKSSEAGVAMANPQFDQYYQQIGYGTVTKKASNLQPLDSYSVKGAYAENSLRLYGKEVTIAIVVLFAFIAICVYLGKKLLAWLSGPKKSDSKEVNTIAPYLSAVGVGFVASCFILAYTVGLFILHAMLRELFGYVNTLFFINVLVGLLSLAIYAFLLFVPSLVMGLKKGSALGIGTFAATVVCVFFELIVALLMLFALSRNGRPPYEIFQSMMGGGMMRENVGKSSEGVPMMEQVEESSDDFVAQ